MVILAGSSSWTSRAWSRARQGEGLGNSPTHIREVDAIGGARFDDADVHHGRPIDPVRIEVINTELILSDLAREEARASRRETGEKAARRGWFSETRSAARLGKPASCSTHARRTGTRHAALPADSRRSRNVKDSTRVRRRQSVVKQVSDW